MVEVSRSEPVLRAENLYKSFGHHAILNGVSFAVEPGSMVGIVGENGAGKSTLLRILAGDLEPTSGAVYRRGPLGYCPQAAVLNDALTVAQHLAYFRVAYGISDLQAAQHLVNRLAYERYLDARVDTLSGGTKQKLNLTLALMHRPTLLLLDEPYQGFDWETYLRFWDLTDDLRAGGCALVVITHLLFEQHRFDHIYHLRAGCLEMSADKTAADAREGAAA